MTIQRPGEIGHVMRNAMVFNIKNWAGNPMNADADSLLASVEQFFALLETRNIAYALVGGIALLYYVEGRNTEDVDIIMASSALKTLPEVTVVSQNADFVQGAYGALRIDILLTKNPLFRSVQKRHATKRQVLEKTISLATVEGLLLLKLYALPSLYRQGDFSRVGIYENDIATLLHEYNPDVAPLLQELSSYVSDSDFTEIETIVVEIQQRIARFQDRQNRSMP
jgi:hypothetical protein